MWYFIKLLLIILLFPTASLAMGERTSKDCFVNDKLRVEIGGERFAFLRKMVHSMRGEDVVNIRGEKYKGNASGQKACQTNEDKPWKVDYLSLDLYPKPCQNQSECLIFKINTYVSDFSVAKYKLSDSTFPYTEEALINKCKPPKRPNSPWHARVWSACNFSFELSNLYFRIMFRGGIYPPEDIENTKQLVLEEIYKYKINPITNEEK